MCIVGWAGQPTLAAPNYALDHLTTRDGLPQSTVKAIAQSEDGYLWIGTEVGLARYDGYQFRRYDAPFGQGVAQRVFADSQGRIWVSWFDKPITVFNPADDSWVVLEAIQSSSVRSGFLEDRHGTIWLIDRSRLYFYDEQSQSLSAAAELPSSVNVVYWQDMLMLNDILWISAFGEIVGYDIEKRGVIARIDYDASIVGPDLPLGGAIKLWVNDERIWFCSRHGVFRVSGLSDIERVFANQDRLISTCGHDNEGQLWIGTFDSGAMRLSTTGDVTQFRHESGSLDTIGRDAVNNIQLDSKGNLWIATYGVANLYREGRFERFEYAPGINEGYGGGLAAYTFFEDRSGVIWYGTESSGLARISQFRERFRHWTLPDSTSTHIRRPATDARGNLWLGTQTGGVLRYDRQSGEWSRSEADPDDANRLPTPAVRGVLVTSDEEVWATSSTDVVSRLDRETGDWTRFPLGGWNGVFELLELPDERLLIGKLGSVVVFDRSSGSFRKHPVTGNATVRAVAASKSGSVFIGTHDGPSVLEFVPDTGFVNSWSDQLEDANVFSLHVDRLNYLWVGTWGNGLFRLNTTTGESQHIDMESGLPDDTVFGILPGDEDDVWLSTYAGLARIENCVVEKPDCDPTITVFDAADGMPMTEFDSEAHYRAPDGELFFGGGDGMISFYPRDIEFNPAAPIVQLTDLQLNGSPLGSEIDVHELDSGFGVLALRFSAMDFHNPSLNRYRYRLNEDLPWTSLDTTAALTLNNLAVGNYSLQILGSNNDGVWSEQPLTLNLRVLPPPYLSKAALTVYAAILFLATFVFIRMRERSLRANERMLESKVASRTRELNDANMARDEFYANVSHEVRTPLTLLLNSVERLSQEDDDEQSEQIRAIRRHSESLRRYIDSLITVSHLSSSPNLEWFAEDLPLFLQGLVADMSAISGNTSISLVVMNENDVFVRSYPNALNAIFSNLLVNALKHTPDGGRIDIVVERSNDRATVAITDSGPGIDEGAMDSVFDRGFRGDPENRNVAGYGIGLNLVKQTVLALGGRISVRNNPSVGACFEIELETADPQLPVSSYEPHAEIGESEPHTQDLHADEGHFAQKNTKPLVLVVEDHDELRHDLCLQLQDEYQVIEAANAASAIALAEKQLPDIVICDVMLPDKDGFEILRTIRENPITDHIAVVMLTALADEASRLRALTYRAEAYLTKPYRYDVLRLTIANILTERRIIMRYTAMKVWQEESAETDARAGHRPSFEHRFMAALQKVYSDNNCGVDDIAAIVAMSRRQLERKTRTCFEQSPNALLTEYRLNKASDFLRAGLSVGETAHRSGFGNQSHFAGVFRKRFGVSPAAYKNSLHD